MMERGGDNFCLRLQYVVLIVLCGQTGWHGTGFIEWQMRTEQTAAERSHEMNQNTARSQQVQDITKHARMRMTARSITDRAIAAVMDYGRIAYVRGAKVFAIGKKEVEAYRRDGIDLTDFEGIHVVCSLDGAIMTTYRNHNLRGLRPRGPRYHRRQAA